MSNPIIPNFHRLTHGGDYNPEQWTPEIWAQDAERMAEVKWNVVSLGIFSWVSLEPEEDRFEWDWLDQAFDRQGKLGGKVCLATPSAATPAWLSQKHPEVLRVGPNRVRNLQGNRVNFCWTSPIYRAAVEKVVRKLAERYGQRPELGLWHISNEYGGECYCDLCIANFREFLKQRYKTLDALNHAYWTAFWGHTYTDWEQISAPGEPHGEMAMTGLFVDWRRFNSQQVIDFYRFESAPCREMTPGVPITTNLMGFYPGFDQFELAPYIDLASWDSYPFFVGPPHEEEAWVANAMSHDLNRSLKGGKPFLLMEHSPSSTNWLSTMTLMRPNVLALQATQALAHGADGIQYFQWRQGRGGSEHSHGAVMTHANRTDVKVYQEVKATGARLDALSDLCGATSPARAAVICDWEVNWMIDAQYGRRAHKFAYHRVCRDYYRPLWKRGVVTDVIGRQVDLGGYDLVLAPTLATLDEGQPERLAEFVKSGGTLVLACGSCNFDHNALNFLGGIPSPLREAVGIWSEEMDELYPEQSNSIRFADGREYPTGVLCERIHVESAEVLATYQEQFYKREPAVTRNKYGEGYCYYVAPAMGREFLDSFIGELCQSSGLAASVEGEWSEGVSVRVRSNDKARFCFVMNHRPESSEIRLGENGWINAVTKEPHANSFTLYAFDSVILRKDP